MRAARLPALLEPVRRCRYCQGGMGNSAEAYRENPFCRACLHERIDAAAAAQGPTQLVLVAGYATVIPAPRTPSSGGRQRPSA
jgi:hypothetical protein